MEFTQKALEKVKPSAKIQDLYDPKTRGLVLRVLTTGAKAFFFTYRMGGRGASRRWFKIGGFESTSLHSAQKQAREYRAKVESGVDPLAELRQIRRPKYTLSEFATVFMEKHAVRRSASTQDSYDNLLTNYISPGLGKVALDDLSHHQVLEWYLSIVSEVMANRALTTLSKMLTLAIQWGDRTVPVNPCTGIERHREAPRLRDVTRGELASIGKALRDLEGEENLFGLAAIKAIILCWGRVSEVLGLQRGPLVKLGEGYALLDRHKTARIIGTKRLELSPPVISILRSLPQLSDNPHYFPGKKSGTHLTRDGLHKIWMRVRTRAGVPDLRLQDFRSLGASEAEAQGINPKTGAALLGHSDERTTMRHYTRVRKAKEAAAQVAAPIAAAMEGKPARKRKIGKSS